MKKTYIQPEVQAYKMVVNKMLMESTTTVTIESGTYEEGSMTDLARDFDFDDEESE